MRSKPDAAASLEQTCAAATRLPGKGKDAVTAGKWEGSMAVNKFRLRCFLHRWARQDGKRAKGSVTIGCSRPGFLIPAPGSITCFAYLNLRAACFFVNVLHCFVSLFTELERRISIPAYLYCVRIKAKRIDLSELASTNLRFAVLQSDIKHSVIEPCRLEGK
jgi:hypothetical protein